MLLDTGLAVMLSRIYWRGVHGVPMGKRKLLLSSMVPFASCCARFGCGCFPCRMRSLSLAWGTPLRVICPLRTDLLLTFIERRDKKPSSFQKTHQG